MHTVLTEKTKVMEQLEKWVNRRKIWCKDGEWIRLARLEIR